MKLKSILATALLLCLSIGFVNAAESTGSITVKINNDLVQEQTFSIYKIADLTNGSLVEYANTEDFSELTVDLNNLDSDDTMKQLMSECNSIIKTNKVKPVQSVEGNKNNNVVFEDLPLGMYYIKLTDGTSDFTAEPMIVSLPLLKNKELLYSPVLKGKYSVTPVSPDKDSVDLVVYKVDKNNNGLEGASFVLRQKEGDSYTDITPSVSGSKYKFNDLGSGTYELYELTAPKGYVKYEGEVKVKIYDGKVYVNGEKSSKFCFTFKNYKEGEVPEGGYNPVEVDTMPKTGDDFNMMPYIAAGAVTFVILIMLLLKDTKEEEN